MRNTHSKLKKLGCFKRVDGFIDSSKDDSGIKNFLLNTLKLRILILGSSRNK